MKKHHLISSLLALATVFGVTACTSVEPQSVVTTTTTEETTVTRPVHAATTTQTTTTQSH